MTEKKIEGVILCGGAMFKGEEKKVILKFMNDILELKKQLTEAKELLQNVNEQCEDALDELAEAQSLLTKIKNTAELCNMTQTYNAIVEFEKELTSDE